LNAAPKSAGRRKEEKNRRIEDMPTSDAKRNFPLIKLGQKGVDVFLDKYIGGDVPPLLFTGPEGSGKEYTAIDFARRLLCSKRPACRSADDACENCKRIFSLEHPAVNLIYPTPTRGGAEGEGDDAGDVGKILEAKREDIFAVVRFAKKTSIRIAQARSMIRRAHTKPFGVKYNIFIIMDAHAMREEAQNALLKLVEEPPPGCVLIFVTPNNDAILYTIRSRCQRLRFSPLKPAVIERILVDYYGVDEKRSRRAATLGRGNIRYALDVATAGGGEAREKAAEIAENVLDAPDSWLLARATELARGSKRDEVALFLKELEMYFRDVMVGDEKLYLNADRKPRITELHSKWTPAKLPRVIELVGKSRDDVLRRNLNIDGALANLFLAIKRT